MKLKASIKKKVRNGKGSLKSLESPVRKVQSRDIKPTVRLLLMVEAGGRCEFDGCNKYLLEDRLTLTRGNFGEAAHIVAFSPSGPRGNDTLRPSDINDPGNLMALCAVHHKLIDDNPGKHTKATLQEYKKEHERRIRLVTAMGPDRKTEVVTFTAPIRGQHVAIPSSQIVEAVAPNYPTDRDGFNIDLIGIADTSPAFIQIAADTISTQVHDFFSRGRRTRVQHISLFALGPIPLLVHLGHQLTNKVPLNLFQRHRDTESWTWKATGKPAAYAFRTLRKNKGGKVALVLSLSGTVRIADLPREVRSTRTIYEITLAAPAKPKTTFLRTRKDLENFRLAYQDALGMIIKNHGLVETIDIFPAVPAPIAVLCGRELLPKVHPALSVYDYDKQRNGFTFQLEVK